MTTIRDVAKTAGVSPITVSRVVNRMDNVNPETRARVEKAIRELGYVRNLAASSLRSRETHTLALILPDITNPFWTTVARGVEDAAQGGGYSVLLCNTDENPEKFTSYLDTMLEQRVDGLLVVPVASDFVHFSRATEMKIPTVVLDRRVTGWDGDSVICDSVAGAQAITNHLLALGHRRIAIVGGPLGASTSEDRVAGYCLALHRAGLPVDQRLILRGAFRSSSGRAMTADLLSMGAAPSAIIATNNTIALGVFEELKAQNKKIPADIAVVGFDDFPVLEHLFPFLTTVVQPAYDMGVNATQLLLSRIGNNGPLRSRQVVLPTRLVLRYSCGRFLRASGPEAEASLVQIPDMTTNQLVKPLDENEREELRNLLQNRQAVEAQIPGSPSTFRPDALRLQKTFRFERVDRLACLAGRAFGEGLAEHLLGRPVRLENDGLNLMAQDAINLARQTGVDALACEISWLPGTLEQLPVDDLPTRLRRAYPPPALAGQIDMLERLLAAAEGSGVGVYARFSSFYEPALSILGGAAWPDDRLERVMDLLAKHQERVMRALCDRFGPQLSLVAVRDDLLAAQAVPPDFFEESLLPRLERMLTPAREHGITAALDATDVVPARLPALAAAGLGALFLQLPPSAGLEEIFRLRPKGMAIIAGLPGGASYDPARRDVDEAGVKSLLSSFLGQPGVAISLDPRSFAPHEPTPQVYLSTLRVIQRSGPVG